MASCRNEICTCDPAVETEEARINFDTIVSTTLNDGKDNEEPDCDIGPCLKLINNSVASTAHVR